MTYAAVILAAGKGTRMNEGSASPIPKVMFKLNGKPMIDWAVKLINEAGIQRVVLVVGYKREIIEDYFGNAVEYAVQAEQLGTGHAVKQAKPLLLGQEESVIVFYGDNPLYKPETVKKLIEVYEREKPTVAMLSVILKDPSFWAYSRIIKDENGNVLKTVEQKDCNSEQLKIKECNPSFYIFDASWLWENIEKLNQNNAQHEYYFTDLLGMAVEQGLKVISMPVSEESEGLGINTLEQLKEAEEVLRKRQLISQN